MNAPNRKIFNLGEMLRAVGPSSSYHLVISPEMINTLQIPDFFVRHIQIDVEWDYPPMYWEFNGDNGVMFAASDERKED